jgi:2-C-methyl-D-erythritol 2,4-cyclodiphosphate synthase/2-C-methyl-D-erythritol 4-phosphate cytidylyltransferase
MSKFSTSAIILAGGVGSRMDSDKHKQFIKIFDKTILERTISAFDKSGKIDEIVVVVREEELEAATSLVDEISPSKHIVFSVGGECRAESAKSGFAACSDSSDFVAIHDAARCLITPEMIDKVVEKAHNFGAATAVCGIPDTVKSVDKNGKITSTISRDGIFRAQTPQVFAKDIYAKAIENCRDFSRITDDNMLVEAIGENIYTVDLGQGNVKITTRDDLTLAESILMGRGEGKMGGFRIGHGYDVHRLTEGRKLIIGGVDIPYEKGLLGHSDADVLVHAIMDSLLGAAALGDIGRHFPDTDEEYRGASSIYLLTKVVEMIRKSGFTVVNIDATLVLQKPKVASYIPEMVSNIALALGISEESVNVKATTEEKLGFTGSEEGACAHSVSMLSYN